MLEHLEQPPSKREWARIFFVTPRKENLPKELLEREGDEQRRSVIFIDDRQTNFMNNWFDVCLEIDFRQMMIDEEVLNKVKKAVELVRRHQEEPVIDEDYAKYVRDMFSSAERDFRRALKASLKNKLGTEFRELGRLVHENEHGLGSLARLYPAQILGEIDIAILSAKMAIGPLVRIDGSVRLDDFLENALLILDEFDSIKDVMLDDVVDSANGSRYDLIRTLRKLIAALSSIEPPDLFPNHTLSYWNELIVQLLKFHRDNRLLWHVKLSDELSDGSRRFMASDFQFTTYIKGDARSNLILRRDEDRHQHVVEKALSVDDSGAEEDPGREAQSLISFLVGCRHLVSRIAHAFGSAAEIRSRETGQEYDFIFEEFFYSICNHFSLDGETRKTLLNTVQRTKDQSSRSIFSEPFSARTFIQKGLQLTEIIDSPRHRTHSRFQEISLHPVPETVLLSWCSRAQVLGMSATALQETAIGNFHIDTLEVHLTGEGFVTPDEDEQQLLRDLHDSQFSGYETGEVKIEVVQTDINCGQIEPNQDLMSIIGEKQTTIRVFRILRAAVSRIKPKDAGYYFNRYLRIIKSLCHFRDNSNIPSALFVLNAHPSDQRDHSLSLPAIQSIVSELFGDENSPYVTTLLSRSLTKELSVIDERLAEGKRVIAFSTYATIGKGVNIQHVVPAEFSPVTINQYKADGRMDWPMIHLDAPTNLLPSLKPGEPFGKDNLKALVQFEYLVLCGALPYAETWNYFSSIFQNRPYRHPQHSELYNVTIREVKQALGRLSRTNMKSPVVHILAEKRLLEIIHFDQTTGDLSIPEYNKLLGEAHKVPGKTPDDYMAEDLANDATNITLETEKKKQNLLRGIFESKTDSINTYRLLRETLLSMPGTDDINQVPPALRSAYIRLPVSNGVRQPVFFRKVGDRVRQVRFSYGQSTPVELSVESSGLPQILCIPEVERHFEDKRYARDFGNGTYVFSPALFDIYKGAIGEVAGRVLLDRFCGVQLTHLPAEHFERFDYLVASNNQVGIDFKHFQVFSLMSSREYHRLVDAIEEKRIAVGLSRVFVINILAENEHTSFSIAPLYDYPNITLVPFVLRGGTVDPQAIDYLIGELR